MHYKLTTLQQILMQQLILNSYKLRNVERAHQLFHKSKHPCGLHLREKYSRMIKILYVVYKFLWHFKLQDLYVLLKQYYIQSVHLILLIKVGAQIHKLLPFDLFSIFKQFMCTLF